MARKTDWYTNNLIYRLVFENLKHRPVRTFLTAIFIGIQVTMILTLVGLSEGVTGDIKERSRGTGADIIIRPANSSALSFTGNFSVPEDKLLAEITKIPHIALANGVLVESTGFLESITGIHLDEFNAMSGGFHYSEGSPATTFQRPDDILVDQEYADSKHLHLGSIVKIGQNWRVSGVVESGKLSRIFAQIGPVQEMFSDTGKVSTIYIKVDQPANIESVVADVRSKFEEFKVYPMKDYMDLISVDNVPLMKGFTKVVIGVAIIVGILVVLLTMYTAVLERTREIGILKALGASPSYIMGILLREAFVLAVVGTIAGILMSYGTQALMRAFAPTYTQVIVMNWWPITGGISLGAALIGAIYPGLKAAHQDAIEALAYD
ncbi:MAG TPA: FtsX-like permease family protein [Bryobacteraceae bacterium]|jgi:putative ABC transport system permease protein